MKNVLVVDDERVFAQTLAEGLASFDPSLHVLTAHDGKAALDVLAAQDVDLVITDLQMPVMDGFQLLAHMTHSYRQVPVLVMTAFGTADIEARLHGLGVDRYIEKPVDFDALAGRVKGILTDGASGFVRGITLPTFLQIIEVEKKTCTLKVTSEGREGSLCFKAGVLCDARTADQTDEAAALQILTWQEAGIEFTGGCRERRGSFRTSLSALLLESMRRSDEAAKNHHDTGPGAQPAVADPDKEKTMAIQDKLKELAGIEGFGGVGVFTPAGESLAMLAGNASFKTDIGVLANNVLVNAQKASLEMGTGRGQQVHIEAEKAHIFARCLNEGTDPLRSQPGKAHIHMVVVLAGDASVGLAKMRMNSVIEKLAEDFR